MKSTLETLATYVPRFLVERLAESELGAYESHEEGVLLFADISGFTALTEKLAHAGPEGAEQLTKLLDTYFGELVDAVLDASGDIIKFAGDALIVVWKKTPSIAPDGLLRGVCANALELQRTLAKNPAAIEASLSLKLSIGYGSYRVALLGGMLGRWETVITGSPLSQVGHANHAAKAGQVVLSGEVRDLLSLKSGVEEIDDGAYLLERVEGNRLEGFRETDFPLSIEPKLRACTPAAIRARVDAGLTDWLGEIRRVSILFVNLPGLNHATPLDSAVELLKTVQRGIYQFEGSLNKISVDDKGASILAVFGLPPLSHSDDPDRALCSAMALSEALENDLAGISIGIATGTVFCGSVGSKRRREYTVLGDTVNLAARLMMAAQGGLLCDVTTEQAARSVLSTLHLAVLPPITLKGKAQPIPIFRPERRAVAISQHHGVRSSVPLFGRAVEQARLNSALDALAQGAGSFVLIRGEAGIGKSRFIEFILEAADERGFRSLTGSAEVTEQQTPYRSWRPIFREFCGLAPFPGSMSLEEEREKVLAKVQDGRAPYLNDVLALGIPGTDATSILTGPFRAGAVRAFLLSLLASDPLPLVLIVEDLHWSDSASLALLNEARITLPKAFILATSRPVTGAFALQPLLELFALPPENQLFLENLAPADCIRLVARRLGIQTLAADVTEIITELAQGHPFFSEELAYALRDIGIDLEKGNTDGEALKLPDTLQGVITARIDRLPPDRQLSLKVASVIGRAFTIETVQGIHPFAGERDRVDLHFEELEQLQLTPLEVPAPNTSYVFKHPLTHEVTYNLMLFSQRRELHRKAATWYEGSESFGVTQATPIAAYHFARSIDPAHPDPELVRRAIAALQSAGDQATHAFANTEALGYYKEAIGLTAYLKPSAARDQMELTLLLALGTVLLASTGYSSPEVLSTYERAAVLCATLGSDEDRFTALRGLWAFFTAKGEYRTAEVHALELLAIAEKQRESALLLEAYRSLGNTLFWIGDLKGSVAAMERTIELYEVDRDRELAYRFGQDPDVACKGLLSWPLTIMGRIDEARARSKESFDRAEEVGHPYSLGYAQVHLASSQQMRREIAEMARTADEVVQFSSARGFPNWLLAGLMLKGWAVALQGDVATGKGMIEGTLATWRGIGCGLAVPYFLTLLAEVYLAEGNAARALEILDDALAVTEKQEERWYEGATWHVRARALAVLKAPSSQIQESVRCSKEAAQKVGANLLLAALEQDQILLGA